MNNIEIARQTLHIIEYRQYEVSGKIIHLPDYDYEDVVLYSPEDVAKLLESNIRYLEQKMADYKAGNLKFADHELIEE